MLQENPLFPRSNLRGIFNWENHKFRVETHRMISPTALGREGKTVQSRHCAMYQHKTNQRYSVCLCLPVGEASISENIRQKYYFLRLGEWEEPSQRCFSSCKTHSHHLIIISRGRPRLKTLICPIRTDVGRVILSSLPRKD